MSVFKLLVGRRRSGECGQARYYNAIVYDAIVIAGDVGVITAVVGRGFIRATVVAGIATEPRRSRPALAASDG